MTNEKSQSLYTVLYWCFTALMLLTAIPLGVVLILVKLFERRRKRAEQNVFHPVAGSPVGSQTTRGTRNRPIRESLAAAQGKMRRRVLVGGVLSAVCLGLLAVCAMNGIELWMIFWCCFCSLTYCFTGLHTLFSLKRFEDYLTVMEKTPILTVGELAKQTALGEKQVRADWKNVEFMELLPGVFRDWKTDTVYCF